MTVRRVVEESAESRRTLDREYLATFSTPSGLKVLEDLEKRCFVHESTAAVDAGGRMDEHRTLVNEGSRLNAAYILSRIERAKKGE